MINFLAEISKLSDRTIHPTPSNKYPKNYNIYELDIRTGKNRPKDEYWEKIWGGHFDNFAGSDISLYYGTTIEKVETLGELLTTNNRMLIEGGIVYINVPMHTWLYPDYKTEARDVLLFTSSAINPDRPSDAILNNTQSFTKLQIPNFSIKLSDNFAGMSLNQGFAVSLANNDGYFDDEDEWNLFNTLVYIKKSAKEISAYEDFKEIRRGYADNAATSFDIFSVTVSDRLRAMNEPVCKVVSNDIFPNVEITESSSADKNWPVVYGVKTIKLLKLNQSQYATAEKVASVMAVFDKDGNALRVNTDYTFDIATGIITTVLAADTATIQGYTNNKIGEIIKDLVVRKANIAYGPTHWNADEVNDYIDNLSPQINIEINSGDVKTAINNVLKSDMAYFIQQLDGKFTIRKYNEHYKTHLIPAWPITQKPEKDYGKAQENYFSSCKINYQFTGKDTYHSFLYNIRENEAEKKYKKILRKVFDTDLTNQSDAMAFAELLGKRYIHMKQTIKIAIGMDTSDMNLLDTVEIPLNINGRKFSNAAKYIIKEINPAQDILVLEETG